MWTTNLLKFWACSKESIHMPHRPGSLTLILQPGVIGARQWGADGMYCSEGFPLPSPQGPPFACNCTCMPRFLTQKTPSTLWWRFRLRQPCGCLSGSCTHGNSSSVLKFSPGPPDPAGCHWCCRSPCPLALPRPSLQVLPSMPWQLSIWGYGGFPWSSGVSFVCPPDPHRSLPKTDRKQRAKELSGCMPWEPGRKRHGGGKAGSPQLLPARPGPMCSAKKASAPVWCLHISFRCHRAQELLRGLGF